VNISIEGFWIKLVLSIICGSIIGLERQVKGKPSGIRTSIFICLGTATFISLGQENMNQNSDVTRVLGQVVTGIGFLGAGVIIAREGLVIGITSASVIWVLAGIGAMIGFGHHAEAIVLSVASLSILVLIGLLENRYSSLSGGIYTQNVQTKIRTRGTNNKSLAAARFSPIAGTRETEDGDAPHASDT
jgi:putative Mg2+ transporter-C (MgtC) family protein